MGVGKSRDARAGRYSRVSRPTTPIEAASWEDATPEDLWRTVQKVTDAGDLISFSKTRDGGAVVLYIRSAEGDVKQYAHTAEEIAELLAIVRASVEDSE